jgi:hypothetical protein
VTGLKTKHVTELTKKWKTEGLATGTIKNRMAHIRWWAEKTNRTHLIPSNDQLGGCPRIGSVAKITGVP